MPAPRAVLPARLAFLYRNDILKSE